MIFYRRRGFKLKWWLFPSIFRSCMSLSNSAYILYHSTYILSHSTYKLSHSTYILSHSTYTLYHSTYILSHSTYILSHSTYILISYILFHSTYILPHSVTTEEQTPQICQLPQMSRLLFSRSDKQHPWTLISPSHTSAGVAIGKQKHALTLQMHTLSYRLTGRCVTWTI